MALLLVSAAMATLPTSADAESAITAFYREHASVVVIQQVAGIAALLAFVLFALSLDPNRWLRPAVFLFVVVELATNLVPLLILATPPAAGPLTRVEDLADAALFVSVALFLVAATLRAPLWLRVMAYVVAAACVVRAIASPLGITALDQIAPLAFVAAALVLSVRQLIAAPAPAAQPAR